MQGKHEQAIQARQPYVLSNAVSCQLINHPPNCSTQWFLKVMTACKKVCCACCLFCTSRKIVPQESYDSLLITQYWGRVLCCW